MYNMAINTNIIFLYSDSVGTRYLHIYAAHKLSLISMHFNFKTGTKVIKATKVSDKGPESK